MARMFPQIASGETKSSAEQKLYRLFEKELDDDFVVFHSVAWLDRDIRGKPYDGEADFVIAHADLGLLVLEVKGGRIHYDGKTDQWSSLDRHGVTHLLKDPIKQVKDAHYSILRKLRQAPTTRTYRYQVCHAISFPDVTVDRELRIDLPPEIVIDQRRLLDIKRAIREVYTFWNQDGSAPRLSPNALQALIGLLAPTIELRSYLAAEFETESQQIKKLTHQQFMALDLLSRERRAIIYGCAGSGKTMLALEKARCLALEGCAVLFVCFNSRLAEWLRASPYQQPGIQITNFHKLCYDLAREARVDIPPIDSEVVMGDAAYFFDTVLPQALVDAVARLGPRYNALIVDEGQDFKGTWWIALETLLSTPDNDTFYIFCDDNQNIYAGAEKQYPFHHPNITLNRNCRNTEEIHRLVSRYYHGTVSIQAQGPRGRQPEIHEVNAQFDLATSLRQCLHRLVNVEHVRPQDIIILTPKSQKASTLSDGMRLGNFVLTWEPNPKPNLIECCTIHSFKGLERPVAILVELDQLAAGDGLGEKLRYVGLSRAINHLIVFGTLV